MKRLPLDLLPDFPKADYWDLIYGFQASLNLVQARLQERNAQLEDALAQIARLEAQLARPEKTSQNASIPPSQDPKRPMTVPKPTQEGPSRQRRGHRQILPQADTVWHLPGEACQRCGADLAGCAGELIGCQRVIEIPPIHASVVELRRYERQCGCGHVQRDAYPEGYREVHQHFGPRIHALISYFNGSHHIAHDRLRQMMAEVFGVTVSDGAIVNSLQRTHERLAPTVADLLQQVRQSAVVGSDETGLKLEGKRGWLWVLQTPQVSYFAAVDSRAGAVLEQLMGDSCVDVWCSDLGSAQLTANARRYAICNAHQLRDLQYVIDVGDTVFAPAMQQLLRFGLHLTKRRSRYSPADYQALVSRIRATASALLDVPSAFPDVQRLQKRFRKHFDAMWLFLDRPDIPFDNNASERALRPAVTHRKVIGAFRSTAGAAAYAAYRSIEDTARKQHRSVFSFLYAVLGTPISF